MGQIEKVFVVAIVVIVGVILGITMLNRGPATAATGPENKPAPILIHDGGTLGGEILGRAEDPLRPGPEKLEGALPPAPGTGQGTGASNGPSTDSTTQTPPAADPPPAPPAKPVHPPEQKYPFATVKNGDSLGEIMLRELGSSRRYLQEVLDLNEGLNPNLLKEGQRIWLPRVDRSAPAAPEAAPAAPTTPAAENYKVQKGDSLWAIAAKVYGATQAARGVARIRAANPGKNLEKLGVGLELKVPR